jgi:hypothetical protein
MTRALSVLRWWYRHAGIKRNAMEPLRAFAQALGKEGTSLVLPDQGFKKLRRRSVRRPKAKGRK